MKYVALIRKEPETEYWIDIPDIPGCVSCGGTEEQAMRSFEEALALHTEAMKEENQEFPTPRSKEEVFSAERDPYLKAYLVEIDLS